VSGPILERPRLYDNSVDDREAQLVLRATEGRVARLYHPPQPWMEPIVARLLPAPA
jgi:hypothetical protein